MRIKGYIKELSNVNIGILIAFWLSNIGSKIKERNARKNVLHKLLNELKMNNSNNKTTIQSTDSLYAVLSGKRDSNFFSNDINIRYIE